jgi:hypothetical protein
MHKQTATIAVFVPQISNQSYAAQRKSQLPNRESLTPAMHTRH